MPAAIKGTASRLVVRWAGHEAVRASALYHVGRISGRPFVTPVVATPVAGGFVIDLPFGEGVDWCRNVLFAGNATLQHRGELLKLVHPRVMDVDGKRSLVVDVRVDDDIAA